MKMTMAAVLACALLATASGAGAQVIQVPLQTGNMGLGGMAGAATVGGSFDARTPGGMQSFNDPRFFVLQGMSLQLDALTPKVSDPKAAVIGVATLLSSPKVHSLPGSPQAVAARIIATVVADPMKVPALGPTLRSLNPSMGSAVMAKLEELTQATSDPEAATERAGLLQRLASVEKKIAKTRGQDGSLVDGVAGRLALDEFFLGGSSEDSSEPSGGAASGWGAEDGVKTGPTVLARNGSVQALPEAWRLRPSKTGSVDGFTKARPEIEWSPRERATTIRVGDLAAAVEDIRNASVGEAASIQEADGTVLPAAYMIRREPRLLRLLRIGEGESSVSRTLTDGRRSLEVLIVVEGSLPAASSPMIPSQVLSLAGTDGAPGTTVGTPTLSPSPLVGTRGSPSARAIFSRHASAEAPAGVLWLGWLAALLAGLTWLERTRFSYRPS